MSKLVSDPEIAKKYDEVRDDKTETNWLVNAKFVFSWYKGELAIVTILRMLYTARSRIISSGQTTRLKDHTSQNVLPLTYNIG